MASADLLTRRLRMLAVACRRQQRLWRRRALPRCQPASALAVLPATPLLLLLPVLPLPLPLPLQLLPLLPLMSMPPMTPLRLLVLP